VNHTHDPALRSWIDSANQAGSEFPVQNLPFGVFSRSGSIERSVCTAIGDFVLDITACVSLGLIDSTEGTLSCGEPTLNRLMSLESEEVSGLRSALSGLLSEDGGTAGRAKAHAEEILIPSQRVSLHLPVAVGDYSDFYAAIHHATNVGSMFRPDNPLLPNYKYVPIGYHGRASSIVASDTPVTRPKGQTKGPNDAEPKFGPTRMLDYEMELGVYVRGSNLLGAPIPIDDAPDHIFGFSLVNDWSARDIQSWEYQPLGPFLSKNFATTVSPWVITRDAAEPYRVPALERPAGDPPPLAYLSSEVDRARGGLSAVLEVHLRTQRMKGQGIPPVRLGRAPFATMYWTVAQMLTHHASNGCNLRPGDLIASGTVSGDTLDARGCMLELTWRGAQPVALPSGETRQFLEDGDEVIMKGYLESAGRPRLGFGECSGVVAPAAA
jgi:fumarylacetoacetase